MKIHNDNLDTIEARDGIQAVINRLNDLANEGIYVFRGYGKQEELYPNIIRDKKSYANREEALLRDFEKYGSSYFQATTPIDFMSYAQHFGLPTRLLDFTRNPFIALSFALYMPKSSNYTVQEDKNYYYVRYASLEENLCIPSIVLNDDMYNTRWTRTDSLSKRAVQSIDSVTDLFGDNKNNRSCLSLTGLSGKANDVLINEIKIRERVILFVDPNQSNQRMIMQQGLFMFPYTLDKDDHLDILKKNSCYVKIHKDLRDKLIQYLDTLGFNTFRLMPDLSSICGAIKRRNIDKRSNLQ